jgi:hypothetical protein
LPLFVPVEPPLFPDPLFPGGEVTWLIVLFPWFTAPPTIDPTGSGRAGGVGSGADCCCTLGTVTVLPPTDRLAVDAGPPTDALVLPAETDTPGSVRASATAVPPTGTATQAVASIAPRTRARPWRM